jgi:hypothetical protein
MSQSRAGEDVEKVVRLTMRSGTTGTERLQRSGISLVTVGDKVTVGLVSFGSEAAKYGLAPGDEVIAVLVPSDRPSRFWFVLPALLLLVVVVMLQRRRIQHSAKSQSSFSAPRPGDAPILGQRKF